MSESSPKEPTWQPADQSQAEGPVQESPPAEQPPPLPLAVKIIGLLAGAGLIALAAWIGITLGEGPEPEEPLWPLFAPSQVGDYIAGAVTESPVPTDEERSILRASYADGQNRVALLMSRPETDLTAYLANAGVEDTIPSGQNEEDLCGTSVDTGLMVCGRIVDETGILMVGLTEQDEDTLGPLLNEFIVAIRGEDEQEPPE